VADRLDGRIDLPHDAVAAEEAVKHGRQKGEHHQRTGRA